MKILTLLYTLAGAVLFSTAAANATTVLPMNLKDLTVGAEIIFVGTVSDIRSEKQVNAIYTYVAFSNLQFVKGEHPGTTIEIRLFGGSVGGETIEVLGMPRYVLGERNLIFLAGNYRYICPVVGWGQGRFKIGRDTLSGRQVMLDGVNRPVTEIAGNQIVTESNARPSRGFPGIPVSGPMPSLHFDHPREQKKPVSLQEFIAFIHKIIDAKN